MGVTEFDHRLKPPGRGKVTHGGPRGVRAIVRARHGLTLLSMLVAAAIGCTAAFVIWHSRQSALKNHLRAMNSMGVVLAEQTSRYIQLIDLVLEEVQSNVTSLRLTTSTEFTAQLKTPEYRSYLAERAGRVSHAETIAVIGADGQVVNWSRPKSIGDLTAVDRDYYRYLKDHKDQGLFIGLLSKSIVTGNLDLYLARRVSGSDGRFLGLILAVVEIGYLTDFYQAAGAQVDETIALLRKDGSMLIRYPNPELAIGVKVAQGLPWYSAVAAGGGSYASTAAVKGVPSIISVHLLRDYPLVINVLMDEAAVFAQWQRDAIYISSFALAASLAFAILFWFLGRQFRQLSESALLLNEGRQILRAYAEMSADWFWEQDSNFRFKFDSGISFMIATDDTGKTRREISDPAMAEERWARHEADLIAHRPFRNFRWERIGSDGQRHFMSTNGDPVFDRQGTFMGYRGTGRDITGEVEAAARLVEVNQKLELSHQQFQAVLDNIMQGICFFDGERRLQL